MSNSIKNDIKIRQICFLFLALMPVNKILLLPSILASDAGGQLWIPLLISFLMDTAILYLILKFGERFQGQTFYNILGNQFAPSFSKVIYLLYGVFFVLKSLLPILEQKYFVDNTLYEVFPNIFAFFPLFLLSGYACVKGLKVLGRCADISIWFSAVGFLTIIYFSITSADFSNLLPIKIPDANVLKASFSNVIWFTESLYMFLFLGHFTPEKKQNTKIICSYLISSAIVILISVIFYGVFGDIAKTQKFAISDMSLYTTKIINIGRFDYMAMFMLLFSKIYAICLPVYIATKCFERAFNTQKALIPAIAINVLLFISTLILEEKLFLVLNFIKTYINWYFILMAYLVPIVLFIFTKRRNREKVQN